MFKLGILAKFKQDTWVKPFFKKYRKSLVLAIFLGCLTFFCGGALMFNSGYLISKSASLPENILLVYIPIVLTRTFGIGRPVFRYLERLVSHNWVLKMTSKLRLKLYQSLETEAMFLKKKYRTGDILALLAEDIQHIQNLYLRTIFPVLIAWILYAFIILALGLFSPFFALWMLLLLGIELIVIPFYSSLKNGALQEKIKKTKNDLYGDLTDNVLGVADWQIANRGSEYVVQHENNQSRLLKAESQLKKRQQQRDFLVEVLFGVITISLLVFGKLTFSGSYGGDANYIAAFVLTVFPLIDAFAPVSFAIEETNIYQDSLTRFNQLPEKRNSEKKAVSLDTPLTLTVENLSFHYPDDPKEVLKEISFTVKPGEKIGILGKSGSGKSTLLSLIRGDLAPTKGTITLNQYPITQLKENIEAYVGVIQQTPYLFHTTVFNNLTLGKSGITKEQALAVLERVGLKEKVQQLPQGLDTMVKEGGISFSGGEKHRLALGRILLQDAPIIILDEATVGLDPKTESKVLKVFFRELKDKTVIWITHHLQGIEACDQVLFIEAGHLTMSGNPAILNKKNPHYQLLKKLDSGENLFES